MGEIDHGGSDLPLAESQSFAVAQPRDPRLLLGLRIAINLLGIEQYPSVEPECGTG